ncbi:hypothetical protein [Agaribacter flavus]|uniref:DUF3806 domain-containing protein n=1 Tax=Agaribacter flavus TaxID=1902781 RepID=A0ABV7FN15_9ALTE
MEQSELDKLMKCSAEDAVSTAQLELAITLDYSPDSIQYVDKAILGFLDKFSHVALEDKAVFTLCNIFGAYIGEVFKKLANGTWIYATDKSDAPSIYMKVDEHTFAFAGVCFEKLVRNQNVSIESYFANALGQVKN